MQEGSKIKKALWQACYNHVLQRIANAESAIDRADDGVLGESKSTAGDKHDVGREMMRAERDKAERQRGEALKLKQLMETIRPNSHSTQAKMGSLVMTSAGKFYFAISVGKIVVKGDTYIAMAPAAPLAQKFKGKKAGDSISFNGKQYTVEEVL